MISNVQHAIFPQSSSNYFISNKVSPHSLWKFLAAFLGLWDCEKLAQEQKFLQFKSNCKYMRCRVPKEMCILNSNCIFIDVNKRELEFKGAKQLEFLIIQFDDG